MIAPIAPAPAAPPGRPFTAWSSLLNMPCQIIKDDKKNKFQALRSVHNLSYEQAKEVYKTYQIVQLTLLAAEDN